VLRQGSSAGSSGCAHLLVRVHLLRVLRHGRSRRDLPELWRRTGPAANPFACQAGQQSCFHAAHLQAARVCESGVGQGRSHGPPSRPRIGTDLPLLRLHVGRGDAYRRVRVLPSLPRVPGRAPSKGRRLLRLLLVRLREMPSRAGGACVLPSHGGRVRPLSASDHFLRTSCRFIWIGPRPPAPGLRIRPHRPPASAGFWWLARPLPAPSGRLVTARPGRLPCPA
jgi:hypothetical protein